MAVQTGDTEPAANQQRQNQTAQQNQDERAGCSGEGRKNCVPNLVAAASRAGCPGQDGCLLHVRDQMVPGTSAFQAARTASFTLTGNGM